MRNKLDKAIPYIALLAATGAAAYSFLKTYKTVKSLEQLVLDLDHDDMLSSLFHKDNK